MSTQADIHFMRAALALAGRNLGMTGPNPSVGCVIVKNGAVIGRAVTAYGGRPHAETQALAQAGVQAQVASVYVTLEPCAHHGKTPPCAQALIDARVKRVFVGLIDPDPRVTGKGINMLREAGIEVIEGLCAKECAAMHKAFILRVTQNRPYITLKAACSLDGKIALGNGHSQWITSALARDHVQLLRARHDAILVGINTVLKDDPSLSIRKNNLNQNLVRVILDSELRINPKSKIFSSLSDAASVLIFYRDDKAGKKDELEKTGAQCINLDPENLVLVMKFLAEQGISSLLVEGGATVHGSFLAQALYDELYIYRAPKLMGGDGLSLFSSMGFNKMEEVTEVGLESFRLLGHDTLEIYKRKA